jgi:hypothetical protein
MGRARAEQDEAARRQHRAEPQSQRATSERRP